MINRIADSIGAATENYFGNQPIEMIRITGGAMAAPND